MTVCKACNTETQKAFEVCSRCLKTGNPNVTWARDPVLVEFCEQETARANRNGEYASNMEVALYKERDTVKATLQEIEEVAKKYGWSEETNITALMWLDNQLSSSR